MPVQPCLPPRWAYAHDLIFSMGYPYPIGCGRRACKAILAHHFLTTAAVAPASKLCDSPQLIATLLCYNHKPCAMTPQRLGRERG